jgi:hypothetical protein
VYSNGEEMGGKKMGEAIIYSATLQGFKTKKELNDFLDMANDFAKNIYSKYLDNEDWANENSIVELVWKGGWRGGLEELKRIFKKKNIEELTADEMKDTMAELKKIYEKAHALNTKDEQLAEKYEHDAKFTKIHKRIKESRIAHFKNESTIHEILLEIKHQTDVKVLDNIDMIHNRDYFSDVTKRTIIEVLEEKGIKDLEAVHFINNILTNEYFEEMVA